MKKPFILTFILLVSVSFSGCINKGNEAQPKEKIQQTGTGDEAAVAKQEETSSTIYRNTQYGFSFSLPESWEGYSIVTDKWEGLAIEGPQAGEPVETGPLISIRHPQWTAENQRQDIPIMVFTLAQWNSLQQGKYHIGAAPIGPKELARNAKYVFALPARYNYAFPAGFEEVEEILASNPLQAQDN